MIITIRGTDSNNNKAAHVTALLAGINASSKSRKSLVLQICKSVPIEDLLIGKKKQETDIRETGFMFEDTGVDALFRRIETQRIQKEHFDACCTPILNSDNLLDIATASTKEHFADELLQREEDIESLIKQAQEIYDDIFIYADSSNFALLDILNKYAELSIICIRQGIKEDISSIPANVIYLVTGYDRNSTYSIRYMKNLYKLKDMFALPYSSEMKDAYNRGTLMQFIGSNERISPADVTYPLISAARSVLDSYLEDKEEEEEETPLETLENNGLEGAELAEYDVPPVEIIEKKRLFSNKTKKIVTLVEDAPVEIEQEKEETAKERKQRLKKEKKMKKAAVETEQEDLEEEQDVIEDEDFEEDEDNEDEEYDFEEEEITVTTATPKQDNKPLAEGEWQCPDCGEINTKKFCLECGCKKPESVVEDPDEWVCPTCGETNPKKAKFCLECGGKKLEPVAEEPTEWTCPTCGEVNPKNAKFCLECGEKK